MSDRFAKRNNKLFYFLLAFVLMDAVIVLVLWYTGAFDSKDPEPLAPVEPSVVVDWRERWLEIKRIADPDERLTRYIALRDSLGYFSEDQATLLREAMAFFNDMGQVEMYVGRFTDTQRRTYIKLFTHPPDRPESSINYTVHDISALTGMRVEYLQIRGLPDLYDYTPISTMQIEELRFKGNPNFTDASLLNSVMELLRIDLRECGLKNLDGLDLKSDLVVLDLRNNKELVSIQGIQGTKAKSLLLAVCPKLQDITPLEGVPMMDRLDLGNTGVYDLRPLTRVKTKWVDISGTRAMRPRSASDFQRAREYMQELSTDGKSYRRWSDWVKAELSHMDVVD